MNAQSPLLLDILRGYSKITHKYKDYYFKHFRIYESLQLEEFELDCVNRAKKQGIKGEDELLQLAINRGNWSKEEESSIKNLNWVIEKSKKAATKIVDYNYRRAFESSIEKQLEELKDLLDKKNNFISHSAENLAKRQRLNREISSSLFYDKEMKQNVEEDDLFILIPYVNSKIEELSNTKNLIKTSYNSYFFDLYCLNYRNPNEIIDTNIYKITLWQRSLLSYASVLLNKLKNLDMPDEIREDPLKVYNFKPKEESPTDNKVIEGVSDLRAKMAQKGGKLTAEDF